MIRVCCVIRKDNKVLLAKHKEKWVCPGFYFDGVVYVADAVEHFLMKNHNILAKIGGIVHVHKSIGGDKTYFLKITDFLGKPENAQWFSINELDGLDMRFEHRAALSVKF